MCKGIKNARRNYRSATEFEVRALLAYITLSFGRKCTSKSALMWLFPALVVRVGVGANFLLILSRSRRILAALPSTNSEIDALWEYFSNCCARILLNAPVFVLVDKYIWKCTDVINEPAEQVTMLMPRKPA